MLADRPESLGRMFFDRVRATPERPAYSFPVGERWQTVTWGETGDRVSRIAAGLISLGIEPEQRVGIAAATRYEWILADLAIMATGAATTTVYPSSRPDDVSYILSDSESRIVFAEDDAQVAKLRAHHGELLVLVKVVVFDGTPDGDWVIGLDDLESLGAKLLADEPEVVERRVASTRSSDLATLIYTSGTTGRPKGVRLPHSAWTYEGVVVDSLGLLSLDDVQFLWLPLAHSFGKVLLSAQLAVGFLTAVDGRVDKIVDNLGVVRPTFMGAAPRNFEKAHSRIVTMATSHGGPKAQLFNRAFAVGRQVARLRREGRPVPARLRVEERLYDRLVFAKIRERFGGRVRFFVSGSAGLNRDIAEWFDAAGVLILEGYGLTETSAGTCLNLPDNVKFGTVGQPFEGSEFRVAGDGELLCRGPGVMEGYHRQPELTAEALDPDGWLHTGDIGEIDDEGFITITDRKKDLFKTSGGKYVAPQIIEAHFMAVCPYASQIVVHGNQRNFVSAIVTLDEDSVMEWAAQQGLGGSGYAEVVTSEAAYRLVQSCIDDLNTRLNRWETVKKFVILDRDLTVEDGEVTPSMKVKRRVVEDRYREHLDALYR
jgi:long-chain acyl-CoA synthetase